MRQEQEANKEWKEDKDGEEEDPRKKASAYFFEGELMLRWQRLQPHSLFDQIAVEVDVMTTAAINSFDRMYEA